ncbi:MAG: DUF3179 domain-containing protein [Candidatus Aenigmarchaeota archaeon]|nr:DUF3179 domain-containing protein [Candidatus Aenigmarchaeota archaeon]
MALKKKQQNQLVIGAVVIVVFVLLIAGAALYFQSSTFRESSFANAEIKTLPDGTKYLVHPDELLSGGPPKGGIGIDRGIPAIAEPEFISVEEATWLADDDIIFGMSLNSEARAYPKQILVWHEIVNDFFGDMPVLVTYCPLCGTGIAFDRTINGEAVRFGTSGKLYSSNLVMYDEKTDSYWTQVGGRAIVGELTGTKLKILPIETMTFADWKKLHPETKVLSRDTGFSRSYGTDPYGDYYTSENVGFGVSFSDTRLHPKAMVAGIVINGKAKAYSVKAVANAVAVNDIFEETPLLIVVNPAIDVGEGFELNPVRIFSRSIAGETLEFSYTSGKLLDNHGEEWSFDGINLESGTQLEQISHESSMWFAWLNFHPDTELYA